MNEDSDEDNFDVNLAFIDSLVNSPDDVCSVYCDEYDILASSEDCESTGSEYKPHSDSGSISDGEHGEEEADVMVVEDSNEKVGECPGSPVQEQPLGNITEDPNSEVPEHSTSTPSSITEQPNSEVPEQSTSTPSICSESGNVEMIMELRLDQLKHSKLQFYVI